MAEAAATDEGGQMTSRISGVPRVLGQVTTGAAFAVFFGLAGAAVANAKESSGGDACAASTAGCGGGGKGSGNGTTGDRPLGLAPLTKQRIPQILKPQSELQKKGEQFKDAAPEKKKSAPPPAKGNGNGKSKKDDGNGKKNEPRQKDHDDNDDTKSRGKDRGDHDDEKKKDKPRDKDHDDDEKKDRGKKDDKSRDHDDEKDDKPRKKSRDSDKKDRESDEDEGDDHEGREFRNGDRAGDDDRKPEKYRGDEDTDRGDEKPSKAQRYPNIRARSVPAASVPTTRLASLTAPASGDGGVPWGDDDNWVTPGCKQDNDGCELIVEKLARIGKPIQDAIGRLLKVESTGPDAGFKPEGPNRKGRIFSVEGYAYADQGHWSAMDGSIEGDYSFGFDGKLELTITKEGPQIDLEALLGAKVSGPEMELPLGPLLVKAKPEISAGIGGQYGVGVERGDDGKRRIKVKGGLTGPVGGNTNLETDLNDKYFGQLPDGGY